MTEQITWTNITVKLGDLKPWENNPRQSTKKQAEKLLQSWHEFGQVETIAVSPDLDLYNGHQRLSALLTVYGKDYVIEARQASRHLSEEEKRKLTITLHAGATGSWDWDNLSSWEPVELKDWGFDDSLLTDWRQGVASLGDFLESEEEQESRDAEPQIDRVAELQKEWGTELGQLWRLESRTAGNEHRLICGDCTDAGVVAAVMGGEKADANILDPPYGIGVDKSMHEKGGQQYGSAAAPKRQYADTDWDNSTPSKEDLLSIISGVSESIIWGGNYFDLPPARCYLVWDKENGDNHYADCELAWSNIDKPVRIIRHMWNGMIRKGGEERNSHPTQKPLAVIEWSITQFCSNPQIVQDFYLGSGTTLIAAENLSRQCRAIEIAPGYVAVALQRYQDAFGITAELIETL